MKEIAKLRVEDGWEEKYLQDAKDEAGETTASKTALRGMEALAEKRKKREKKLGEEETKRRNKRKS